MAWLRDKKLTVVFLLAIAMTLSIHTYAITVISGNVVVSGHFNDVTGIKVLSTAGVNNAGGVITYTGTLEIQSNPTFTNTGTMGYVSGNTLLYSGTTLRTGANEWTLSASALNVTINNTGGVVLPVNSTINGLTLTAGILQIGNFNLTAATLTGGSSSTYIADNGTGLFTLNTVPTSKAFPIGPTTTDYTPLSFTNVNSTPNLTVGVRQIASAPNSLPVWPRVINLDWTIKSSVTLSPSPNVSFQFNAGDENALFDLTNPINLYKYSGTLPWTNTAVSPYTGTNPYTIAANGVGFAAGTTYGCVLANLTSTRCTIWAPTLTSTIANPGTVCAGASVSFTANVAVGSTTPLSYQWWRVGTPNQYIEGAVAKSYGFSAITTVDAGVYYCVVTNCGGSVTTPNGTVGVTPAANASTPANTAVLSGGTAIFNTTSAGTGFTYQWYNGVTPISTGGNYTIASGANTSSLTVTNVTATTTFKVSASNSCGTANSGIATVTVLVGNYVWTGASSTAWETGANWSGLAAPTALNDAFIQAVPNKPVVSSNTAACKNLVIYPSASVTVNGSLRSAASVTISPLASVTVASAGTFNVAGNLLIQATNAGTGALLDNNTTAHVTFGTSTVQKYLGAILNAYHYTGSPFQTSTINNIAGFVPSGLTAGNRYYNPNIAPNPYPNILFMDQQHTHNLPFDYNGWEIPKTGEVMVPLAGFSPYYQTTSLVSLASTSTANHFNTGDQTLTATVYANSTDTQHNNIGLNDYGYLCSGCANVGVGPTDGQYLVGNPYPTPVDLASVYAFNAFNSMLPQFNYWVPTKAGGTGRYAYYNGTSGSFNGGSQYLPVMCAVFVIEDNAGGPVSDALTFRNADRTVAPEALLYNPNNKSNKNANLQMIRLNIAMANNSDKIDEAGILFASDAKMGINHKYDGAKMMNTDAEYANLYTINSNKNFVVKSYPEITENLTIPLGVTVNTDSKYTINASEINNLPSDIHVYLVDTKLNSTQDLTKDASYSFDMTGVDNSRFYLKFSNAVTQQAELCNIYSSNKDLFVNYNNPGNEQADLKVYTVTGDLLTDKVSLTNGTYHTQLNVAPGIYLVKVVSSSNVYVQKVYIQ